MTFTRVGFNEGPLSRPLYRLPIELVALGLKRHPLALRMFLNQHAVVESTTDLVAWRFHSIRGPGEFIIEINPGEGRKFFRAHTRGATVRP